MFEPTIPTADGEIPISEFEAIELNENGKPYVPCEWLSKGGYTEDFE